MATYDIKKTVKYLNKDFKSIRNSMIDFSKVYFPDEYKDFSDSSVGMMFIEMVSSVGDTLSYYTDNQLNEMFIQHSTQRKNVINNARSLGYKTKPSSVSYTKLNVFQIVPSTGTYSERPDYNYAMKISDLRVSSKTNSNITFRALSIVDFAESGSSETTVSVYETDSTTNKPTYYLLTKEVDARSGIYTEKTYTVGSPQKFYKILLPDDDIVEILSITDSEGNEWKEVDYLAQDSVLTEIDTRESTEFSEYSTTVPYMLKYTKTSKRFVTNVRYDNRTEIMFGAGSSAYSDEILIPNHNTIHYDYFNQPVDPRNFLNTSVYGEVPSNTVLTIKYLRGAGLEANLPTDDLTIIDNYVAEPYAELSGADLTLFNSTIRTSLAATNIIPAVGSRGEESLEEISLNAKAYFSAQDRCVTKDDYIIRTLSMSPKYGSIAKAYIVQDDQLRGFSVRGKHREDWVPNPLALNLYVLGYDGNKKLTQLNAAVKENLKNYLDRYRIVTDAVNIKDGYIINIGVDFDIITYSDVINKKEVILKCVEELKDFFAIDKWQIGQAIVISEIYNLLDKVDGVRTVQGVHIYNKNDVNNQTYSNNYYDIMNATRDGVIYTSMDPSIFEVKYPNTDIRGRAK